MRIGWGKRVASGITAAAMAFTYLMPFNGIPAAAVTTYTVDVSYFDKESNPASIQDAAEGYQYYTLVTLKNADGELSGWAVDQLDISGTTDSQTFEAFKACSTAGVPDGEEFTYNSDEYTGSARIYRVLKPDELDLNSDSFYLDLTDASRGIAVDTVPGYSFTNTAKADGAEYGRDITLTRSDVTYTIDIDYGNAKMTDYEHIYLLVTAQHGSGEGAYETYYFTELRNDLTEVEVQTVDDSYWMDKNGNYFANGENRLGGTETVTMELYVSSSGNLLEGDGDKVDAIRKAVKIEEGALIAGGKVSFDETVNAVGGYQVTELVSFGNVPVSNDTNFRKILGNAVNYGIVADEWYKPSHAQTNFAVNYYQYKGNVDQDLTGENGGNIWIGHVVDFKGEKEFNPDVAQILTAADGYLVDLGASHCGPVTLHINPDNIQQPGDPGVANDVIYPRALTDKGRQVDYGGWVTVISTPPEETASVVNSMIEYMQGSSAELAKHDPTLTPYHTGSVEYINTTGFPSDATIYIDGDKFLEDVGGSVGGGNVLLEIVEGQTIVFNFKTTTDPINLGEMLVNYHFADEADYEKYDPANPSGPYKTNTAPATSMGTRNNFLEKLTKQLVWNFAGGQTANLGPATAGIFLNPDPDSEMYVPSTSTGWICTAGYFENTGDEWHNVFTELDKVVETGYEIELSKIDKNLDPLPGATISVFAYDPETDTERFVKSITTGSENPNLLKGLDKGKYIIRETAAPAGYQLDDETEYYVEIDEENGELKFNAANDHANYTKKVIVKVYNNKTFQEPPPTNVKERAEYSPFEILSYEYEDSISYKYTFELDENNHIVIIRDGNVLADSNGDTYSFSLDEATGRTIIYRNGEEIAPYSFGYETTDDPYGTEDVSVYKDGVRLNPTLSEGDGLDEIFSDPVITDGIYLYLLHATDAKTSTMFYNGQKIEAEGGVYTLPDGRRCYIEVNPEGAITRVQAPITNYFTLTQSGNDWVLNYYANGTGNQSTPTDSAVITDPTADGPGNNYTVTANLANSWGEVTVPVLRYPFAGGRYYYSFRPGWDQRVTVNDTTGFSSVNVNYIVTKGIDVLATTINISDKLQTVFQFTNQDAYTVKKVDGHGRALKSAYIAMVPETYSVDGNGYGLAALTSAIPEDGSTASDSILSWTQGSTSSAAFDLSDLTANGVRQSFDYFNYSWTDAMSADHYTYYRITETITPEGYEGDAHDIILAYYTHTNFMGYVDATGLYKLVVDHGAEVTEPLFADDTFAINPEWEKVDTTSAEGRTFTLTNNIITAKVGAKKIDGETEEQLGGASFSLYRYTEGEDVHDPWLADFTTDETGAIDLQSLLNNDDLVAGVYYLVEITAPEGYDDTLVKNATPLYFTINTDRTVYLGKPADATERPITLPSVTNGEFKYFVDPALNLKKVTLNVTGSLNYDWVKNTSNEDVHFTQNGEVYTVTLDPDNANTVIKEIGVSGSDFTVNSLVFETVDGIIYSSEAEPIPVADLRDDDAAIAAYIDKSGDAETGYVLAVKNNKLHGAQISVGKVDADNTDTYVADATIEVYQEVADGDDVLIETIDKTVDTGATELTKELFPGVYYLVETEVPTGYSEDLLNEKLYFTVTDDLTVLFGKVSESSEIAIDVTIPTAWDNQTHQIIPVDPNGNTMNQDSWSWDGTTGISDVTSIVIQSSVEVKQISCNEEPSKTVEGNTTTLTFASPVHIYKLDIQNWEQPFADDVVIKFYTEDGKVYSTSTEAPVLTEDDPESKLLHGTGEAEVIEIQLPNKQESGVISITKSALGGAELPEDSEAEYTLTFNAASGEGATTDFDGVLVNGEEVEGGADKSSIEIKGNRIKLENLKDGTYTLEEKVAPDGFTVVTSTFTFTVADGEIDTESVVATTDGTTAGVMLDENNSSKIVVLDNISTISVSKEALGGETISEDNTAEYRLTFVEAGRDGATADFEGVTAKNGEDDAITKKGSEDGKNYIEFSGNAVDLTGLKDGTYTLKETVSPDGYTVVESEFTFTITNGVIDEDSISAETTGETKEAGISATGETQIVVLDDISTISVSKEALGGEAIDEDNTAEYTLTFVKADKGDTADFEGVKINGDDIIGDDIGIDDDENTFVKFSGNTVELTGLKDGTYTLKETVAPDGYTLVESEFTFTVKDGVIDTENVKATTTGDKAGVMLDEDDSNNIVILDDASHIKIDKTDMGAEPIADDNKAIFKLYSDNTVEITDAATGEKKTVSVLELLTADDSACEVKEDENGKYIEFEGNSAELVGIRDGSYTLVESVAPLGYKTVTSEFTFTIENGVISESTAVTDGDTQVISQDGDTRIVVMDDASLIKINKEDLGGTILDDSIPATFRLYSKDTIAQTGGDAVSILNDALANGESAEVVYDEETGYYYIEFLGNQAELVIRDGSYELEEYAAPDGYTKVTTRFNFTVEGGVISDSTAVTDGKTDVIYQDGKEQIIVKDDISTINVSKKALNDDGTDHELGDSESEKANYELTGDTDKLIGVKVNGEEITEDDITDGVYKFSGNDVTFEGLKDGSYTLKEVVAPDGFTTVTTEFKFTVENGVITDTKGESDGKIEVVDLTDEEGNLIQEEGKIIFTDKASVIKVNKKDGNGYLANAWLKLTLVDAAKSADADLTSIRLSGADRAREDADGNPAKANEIIWKSGTEDVIFTMLPDGVYTLEELKAPDDTYLLAKPTSFVIDQGVIAEIDGKENTSGTDLIPVLNSKRGEITIKKTDMTGKKELEGAELELYDSEGNLIDSHISGEEEWVVTLKEGTYTIVETTAPDGYTIKESTTFEVDEEGNVTKVEGSEVSDNIVLVEDAPSTIQLDKTAFNAVALEDEAEFKLTMLGSSRTETDESGAEVQKKADFTGVTLNGTDAAEFLYTDEEGVTHENVIAFTGNSTTFLNLKDGVYELEETAAPDGYTVVSTFRFTVDQGVITTDVAVTNGNVVKTDDGLRIEDAISTITVDKAAFGSEALDDSNKATFRLYADDEALFSGLKIGDSEETAEVLTDEETGRFYVEFEGNKAELNGLKDGSYELEEHAAPDGYTVVSNFTFTVENGVIDTDSVESTSTGQVEVTETGVKILDKRSEIEISKKGLNDEGDEVDLEDNTATFKLYAAEENQFTGAKIGDDDVTVLHDDEKNLFYVEFEGNDKTFVGLKDGEYTLEESKGPEGYETISDFTFNVENGAIVEEGVTKFTTGEVRILDDGSILVLDLKKEEETTTTTTTTETETTTTTTTTETETTTTTTETETTTTTTTTETETTTTTTTTETTTTDSTTTTTETTTTDSTTTTTETTTTDSTTTTTETTTTDSTTTTTETTTTVTETTTESTTTETTTTTTETTTTETTTTTTETTTTETTTTTTDTTTTTTETTTTTTDTTTTTTETTTTVTETTTETTTTETTTTTTETTTETTTTTTETTTTTTETTTTTTDTTTTTTETTTTTTETTTETTTTETTTTTTETTTETTTTETTTTTTETTTTETTTTTTETTTTTTETTTTTTTTETTTTTTTTETTTTTTETTTTTTTTETTTTTTETTTTTTTTETTTTTTETTTTTTTTETTTTTTETTTTTTETTTTTTTTETTTTTTETTTTTTTTETTTTTTETTTTTTTTETTTTTTQTTTTTTETTTTTTTTQTTTTTTETTTTTTTTQTTTTTTETTTHPYGDKDNTDTQTTTTETTTETTTTTSVTETSVTDDEDSRTRTETTTTTTETTTETTSTTTETTTTETTTTTTETTVPADTTTTTTETTTTTQPTTAPVPGTPAAGPRTGDEAPLGMVIVTVLVGAAAFALRKRREDEEQ